MLFVYPLEPPPPPPPGGPDDPYDYASVTFEWKVNKIFWENK